MSWSAVAALVLGGGLVAAALTSSLGLLGAHLQRREDRAAAVREAARARNRARRIRLAPLYAAVVRSAIDIAETDFRKTYRLASDDEEEVKKRLADTRKAAQARLDEVDVPLELEAGTEAFEARFRKFRDRYMKKLTAVHSPIPGVTSVTAADINIDLFEDVRELKAIAQAHLAQLDELS